MLEAGELAPEFTLSGLDGQDRGLAGGRTLLAFFKVSCPVCQFTFPYLERLHKNAPAGAAQFIGISQDNSRDTREFLEEFGVTFPMLLDDPGAYAASNGFRISYVPSMFLVEPDGKVSWASNGFSRPELEDLGRRLGAQTFLASDDVPDWKSG